MKKRTTPTRRTVIKAGSAAVMVGVAPMAGANTPPQLPRHSSREILLEFDVIPGIPGKLKFAARPLRRPGR